MFKSEELKSLLKGVKIQFESFKPDEIECWRDPEDPRLYLTESRKDWKVKKSWAQGVCLEALNIYRDIILIDVEKAPYKKKETADTILYYEYLLQEKEELEKTLEKLLHLLKEQSYSKEKENATRKDKNKFARKLLEEGKILFKSEKTKPHRQGIYQRTALSRKSLVAWYDGRYFLVIEYLSLKTEIDQKVKVIGQTSKGHDILKLNPDFPLVPEKLMSYQLIEDQKQFSNHQLKLISAHQRKIKDKWLQSQ